MKSDISSERKLKCAVKYKGNYVDDRTSVHSCALELLKFIVDTECDEG